MFVQLKNTCNNEILTACSSAQWENYMDELIHDVLLYIADYIIIETQQQNFRTNPNLDTDIMEKWTKYQEINDCTTRRSFRFMLENNREFLILLTNFHVCGIYNLVFYDDISCFSSGQTRDILMALTSILASTEKEDEYKKWLDELIDYLQPLNYNMDFELYICHE